MGRARHERTWRTPRRTRHVWVQLGTGERVHPHQPPCQGLLIAWRRRGWRFEGLVVIAQVDPSSGEDQDPIIIQRWVPSERLRPVPSDPNRAFGLR